MESRSYPIDPYAQYFVAVMAWLGYPVRITETFRDPIRQAKLYAQGRSEPGAIITNAPPGTSYHEYGRAFDITFIGPGFSAPDSWWSLAGEVGEWMGLRWGGRFKSPDRPHFEI